MFDALCVLYLSLFLAVGYLCARRALPTAGAALLIPLGCGMGVSMLALVPAALALIFGFTLPAVIGAAFLVLILGLLLYKRGARFTGGVRTPREELAALLACLIPLLVLTIVLLHTHVLHLVDGEYHTGQSCYGDMPMHLGFIKYIASTGEFPPSYPLLGGEHRFGYPFLCETVSSVFVVLGAELRTAYILPMLPAFVSVYGMLWQLARRVSGSAGKASLAFWLFFMGSGFGFVYFLGSWDKFAEIFTGYYTTPTNYTAENIVWVNPVVDMLLPQRATLFGWAVLFPAFYLLWRFAMEEESRLWLSLALLVLPLPLMQTHSALALVLVCFVCGMRALVCGKHTKEVLLPWLMLALLCGTVWLAEMWDTVFAQSMTGQHMLRQHFNWINGDDNGVLRDNYFWFYIKNIGLVYILLIPAFVRADPKQRWFYGGGLLILVLAELVVFQPNNYDNNKLLYIWHMLGCILVAQLLADITAKLKSAPCRAAALGFCVFIATFGSVLTVGRELVSDYRHFSAGDIELAEFVDENTEADTLFLTADNVTNPVFSLAGRRILCGSGSWVYYHGMDYSEEYYAVRSLYASPSEAELETWGVDYAVFDSYVSTLFDGSPDTPDEGWYAARYELVYSNADSKVYKIS